MSRDRKLLERILREMFRRVGRKYIPSVTEGDCWYMENSWTRDEQEQFREWLVSLLQREMSMTEKGAELEAGYFLLSYGWMVTPEGVFSPKKERMI